MSINRIEITECPSCHEQIPVVTWQSLNADLDPAAKEKLLDGSLFWVTCPRCQKRSYTMYPMLYHDKEHGVMIQLIRELQEVDEFREIIASFEDDPNLPPSVDVGRYRYRVVWNGRDLREKAQIFNLGLDDRVIEVVKFLFSAVYQEQNPGQKVTRAHFESEPSYKIQMVTEGGILAESDLSMEDYTALGAQFQARIDDKSKDYLFIDYDWAMSLFVA